MERAIRTVKEKVLERQETLGIKDWTEAAKYVVDQYNDEEHTTTKVAPNDAAYAKYEDVVRKTLKKTQHLTENTRNQMKGIWRESTRNLGNIKNSVLISIIGSQVRQR